MLGVQYKSVNFGAEKSPSPLGEFGVGVGDDAGHVET